MNSLLSPLTPRWVKGVLDFDQLKTFLCVVENESFSKAAQLLHVTQPTVTQRISNLELELGCLLFERKGKTFSLTNEGKHFHRYAVAFLNQLNHIKEEFQVLKKPKLKIGFPPSFSPFIIAKLTKEFDFNRLYITLVKGSDSVELTNMVLEGTLHLAFLSRPINHQDLTIETLFSNPVLFMVSPNHHLAKLDKIGKDQLANETMICYTRNTQFAQIIENELASVTMNRIEANSIEIVKELVKQGLGFAILPGTSVHNAEKEFCIKEIHEPKIPYYHLHVIYRKYSEKTEEIQKVISFVRRWVASPAL